MNPPIGANFIEGPLGVVDLNFNNVGLGKTMGGAELEFIEDMKDIKYDQDGTQPSDKIPTGQAYQVTCKLAEPEWARLEPLMRGLTVSPGGNSVLLGSDIYRSGKVNFAKVLVITRVDSDGNKSTDPKFRLTMWKALPMVTGAIGPFEPDTQRTVNVVFYCFYDETAGHEGYGFSGCGSSVGVY